MRNYYPGDDVVDWVGVSIYGAQTPDEEGEFLAFAELLDEVHPRLTDMAPQKPICIAEMGTTKDHISLEQAPWTRGALENLLTHRWERVIGLVWWNEKWTNPNGRPPTNMRVQDSPDLKQVFLELFGAHAAALQESPIIRNVQTGDPSSPLPPAPAL